MRVKYLLLAPALATAWIVAGALTPNATALKQFEDNVQSYFKMRHRVALQLEPNKKSNDPAEIDERKRALAVAIQRERHGAKAGEIFGPEASQYFVGIIRSEAKGSTKNATKEGNPQTEGAEVRLAVNAPYPDDAPLSTMPPSLLLKLPKLPEGLEYRFVGRHLILHDVLAGLIVDYVRDAM